MPFTIRRIKFMLSLFGGLAINCLLHAADAEQAVASAVPPLTILAAQVVAKDINHYKDALIVLGNHDLIRLVLQYKKFYSDLKPMPVKNEVDVHLGQQHALIATKGSKTVAVCDLTTGMPTFQLPSNYYIQISPDGMHCIGQPEDCTSSKTYMHADLMRQHYWEVPTCLYSHRNAKAAFIPQSRRFIVQFSGEQLKIIDYHNNEIATL